jgi:hypothetical protein
MLPIAWCKKLPIFVKQLTTHTMKFNFCTHLKGKDIQYLTELRESMLQDLMEFISCGHKDATKLKSYIGYIDNAILKLNK